MRSRSVLIRRTEVTRRRSTATGWCSARTLRHSSSTWFSSWSMSLSPSMTSRARGTSRACRARIALWMASSTEAARASRSFCSSSRSRSRCLDISAFLGCRPSRALRGLGQLGSQSRPGGRNLVADDISGDLCRFYEEAGKFGGDGRPHPRYNRATRQDREDLSDFWDSPAELICTTARRRYEQEVLRSGWTPRRPGPRPVWSSRSIHGP